MEVHSINLCIASAFTRGFCMEVHSINLLHIKCIHKVLYNTPNLMCTFQNLFFLISSLSTCFQIEP
jgi:hypothetical protein